MRSADVAIPAREKNLPQGNVPVESGNQNSPSCPASSGFPTAPPPGQGRGAEQAGRRFSDHGSAPHSAPRPGPGPGPAGDMSGRKGPYQSGPAHPGNRHHPPDFGRHQEAPAPGRRHAFRDGDWRGGSLSSPADEDQNWRAQAQPPSQPRRSSFTRHSGHGHEAHGFNGRDSHRMRDRDIPSRDEHDAGSRGRQGFSGHDGRGSGGGGGPVVRGSSDHAIAAHDNHGGQSADYRAGPRSLDHPPPAQPSGHMRIMQRAKPTDSGGASEVAESPPSSAPPTQMDSNSRGLAGKRSLYNHLSGEFVPEPERPKETKRPLVSSSSTSASTSAVPERRIAQRPVSALATSDDQPSTSEAKDETDRQPNISSDRRKGDGDSRLLGHSKDHAAAGGRHAENRKVDTSSRDHPSSASPLESAKKGMNLDEAITRSDSTRKSRRQSKGDRMSPVVVREYKTDTGREENGGSSSSSSAAATSRPASSKAADSGSHRPRKRLESADSGDQASPMASGHKAPGLGKQRSEHVVRQRTDHDRTRSRSVTTAAPAASPSGTQPSSSTGKQRPEQSRTDSHHDVSDKSGKAGSKRRKADLPDNDSPTGDPRQSQRRSKQDRKQHQQQHGDDHSQSRGNESSGARRRHDDTQRRSTSSTSSFTPDGDGSERPRAEGRRSGEGKREDSWRTSKDYPRNNVGPRLRNADADGNRHRGSGEDGKRPSSSQRHEDLSSRRSGDTSRATHGSGSESRRSTRESHAGSEDHGTDAGRHSESSSHRAHEAAGGTRFERSRSQKAAIEKHLDSGRQSHGSRRRNQKQSPSTGTPDSSRALVPSLDADSVSGAPARRRSVSPAEVRHIVEVDGVPHESVISLKQVEPDFTSALGARPPSPSPLTASSIAVVGSTSLAKPDDLQLSSTDNSEEYNTPPSSLDEALEGDYADKSLKLDAPASKGLPAAEVGSAVPASVSKSVDSPGRSESPAAKKKPNARKDDQKRSKATSSTSRERSSSAHGASRAAEVKRGTNPTKKSSISDIDLNSSSVCVVDDLPEPSSNVPLVDQDFCLFPDSLTPPNPEEEFQEVLPRGRKRKTAAEKSSKAGSYLKSPTGEIGKVSVRDGSPHRDIGKVSVRDHSPHRRSKASDTVEKPGTNSSGSKPTATAEFAKRASPSIDSPTISVSPALADQAEAGANGKSPAAASEVISNKGASHGVSILELSQ